VTLYVRLVFSANHPPRSNDSSHAFFRRWVVLPFTHTFEEHEQKPRRVLDMSLSRPQELSGVLNRALAAIPQLLRCGFKESTSMLGAHDEFRRTTDPFAVWLERETVESNEAILPIAMLRTKYNAVCRREGRPVMTDTSFGLAFKRIKPHIEKKQRMHAGEQHWCYINIGLRDHS
jgi:putative DNA primase/helicase